MTDLPKMSRWLFTRLMFKWWQVGMLGGNKVRWGCAGALTDAVGGIEEIAKRQVEAAERIRDARRLKNLRRGR